MTQSRAATASQATIRLAAAGVGAVICTLAAVPAWLSLAFSSLGAPGFSSSHARQRRGRAT